MGYCYDIPGAVSGAPVAAYWEEPFGGPLGREFKPGLPTASHHPAVL